MRSSALAAAAVCTALAAPAHASTTVTDAAHGFTIHVPDGYEDFPAGRASPNLYAWKRGTPSSFEMIAITDLGAEIAEGPIDLDVLERTVAGGSHFRLGDVHTSQLAWNHSQIPTLSGVMSDFAFVGAEVPLPDNAVMVLVMGTGSAGELDATLHDVMSTFDGENSWTGERDRRIGWVVGGVGVVLGAVILFAKLESRRRRGV
jgi:hypothetical protein